MIACIFISSDAANLTLPNEHFESVGTAFTFCNMAHRTPMAARNISEVIRAFKADGRFIFLATSQPKNSLIKICYHLYMCFFVLLVIALISGSY